MNISWDAEKYTHDFSFVHEYGNALMDLIDFASVNSVIDLGCGNGALTAAFAERGLSVTGIDSSPELLSVARKNYPRIDFIEADATTFSVDEPVDLIFSNAVFHWIDKERQSDMLACVTHALKEGGQFVFEFGGKGNNAIIHSALDKAFSSHGYSYHMPFYFPSISEYSSLVENAGLEVLTALLFDRPTLLKGPDGLGDWIRMFVKTPFEGIPETEKDMIITDAVSSMRNELFSDGNWYADYVRIRMRAVKTR